MCGSGAALGGEQGRCGYGPRLPLLVISPWAAHDVVDHTLTDQSSIIRFVEDNWELPRISGSFDAKAGTLNGLFDFKAKQGKGNAYGNAPNRQPYLLEPATGEPLQH
jgi:phospholipase C